MALGAEPNPHCYPRQIRVQIRHHGVLRHFQRGLFGRGLYPQFFGQRDPKLNPNPIQFQSTPIEPITVQGKLL
jgi:hypothetical protein